MLVSWKHNFIFIHIPKTAGTSLTQALAPFARREDRFVYGLRKTSLLRRGITLFLGGDEFIKKATGFAAHARLIAAEDAFGREKVEAMHRTAFVRNPFTRAYSLYDHIRRDKTHPHHETFLAYEFSDAVQFMCEKKWPPQVRFLRFRREAKTAATMVGRFEALQEDFPRLFERLSLPAPRKLPRVNLGNAQELDYATLFGSARGDFLECFAEDFESLGYSTDPADALKAPDLPSNLRL